MALNPDWIEVVLTNEVSLAPPEYPEDPGYPGSDSHDIGRAAIDGALVIYDPDDPPHWLRPMLDARDEDGNTQDAE